MSATTYPKVNGVWTHSRNVTTVAKRTYQSVAYGRCTQRIQVHQDGPIFWATLTDENPHGAQRTSGYCTSREQAEAEANSFREYFS